jgi:DNA integrity scanning protein DisA with diadenylate cyclase activity
VTHAQEDSTRHEARIRRLAAEIDDEHVPILGAGNVPPGLTDADGIILDELLYARHIPVHEGLRPPYGSMIVTRIDDIRIQLRGTIETTEQIGSIRPFIDGRTTLLIRDLDGHAAVGQVDVSDELRLLQVTRETHGVAVQRLEDGRIKVATRRSVAINDGHEWFIRAQAREVISAVVDALQLPTEGLPERLRGILDLFDLCFHRLSPQGIGATFVVMLVGTVEDIRDGLTDAGYQPAIQVNAFATGDRDLMVSMLASVDGACLLEQNGAVALYQAKLKTSEESIALIAQQGGTRHTSAKRFSFSYPQCLVVVVSADGPVTLFADGIPILKLWQDSADEIETWRTRLPVSQQRHFQGQSRECDCDRCARRIAIDYVVAQELDHGYISTSVPCPICGNELLSIDGAIQVTARPVKPWQR